MSEFVGAILSLIGLLFLSATFASSEVAFFSLNANQLAELKESDHPSDKKVDALLKQPKLLLATLLIGNNFVNITIVMVSYLVMFKQLSLNLEPWQAFLLQSFAVTALIVLFGEIVPKVLATNQPLSVARKMATPIGLVQKLLYPFSSSLASSTSFFDKRFQPSQVNVSIDEINHAIDLTYDKEDTEEEKDLLKGIVNFGNLTVKQVMQPRTAMEAIDFKADFLSIKKRILDTGYSRLPVFKDKLDHIEGILHVKDLLRYTQNENIVHWQQHIRKAYFVPEKKRIDDLFNDFKSKRIHMAIVVDEYGGCSGLITLEDILEEIVGDISDEFDEQGNEQIREINENCWEMQASTLLTDVCKILDIDPDYFDEVREDADSVAGLIIAISGEIPTENDKIEFENLRFTILKANNRKIEHIQLERILPDDYA